MKILSEIAMLAAKDLPQKQKELKRPLSDHPKPLALRESQESKRQLTNLIFQCFQSLKLYGKEPEALEEINAMFHFVLADYPLEKISQAIAFYLKTNDQMPAPADIAMIIERGNKPPFDKSVYIAVCKKNGEDRTPEEWEYKNDYEKYMISGLGA